MKFFKRLFGTAAVAGTAVAATQVGAKVKENNPDGIQDVNGDGKVDAADYIAEVKKAATELYGDKAEAVKEAVQNAIENPAEAAEKVKESVKNAYENVAAKVKDGLSPNEEAPAEPEEKE